MPGVKGIERERAALLEKLGDLLQAPEARPWAEVARELRALPVRTLRSLEYRIRSAMATSFEDGGARGD